MLRLTARDGAVVADAAVVGAAGPGRASGRGCYLCRSAVCVGRAVKGRQVGRALKGKAAELPAERLLALMGLAGQG